MHLELLLLLISGLIIVPCSAAVYPTETKPGCKPKCGHVEVPYPFGIGRNCSIAPWANINCNTTFNPPKPFIGDLEVAELLPTEVRIKNLIIATTCYNQSGGQTTGVISFISLGTNTPYTFSSTKNKLTAIGCDTLGLASFNNNSYSSGCTSLCSKIEDVTEGTCSGIGCCQASIPKGQKNYRASAGSVYQHSKIWSFNKCSSTFLAEEDKYTFKVSDFENTSSLDDVPIVLNFAIGNQTCREGERNSTTFACKENSYCYDSVDGTGYLCKCSKGYEGNPYLSQGCKDVNECDKNPCKGICTNTQGSYQCSCPDDAYGDGTKEGSGCTKKNT